MKCRSLAARLESLEPNADCRYIARLCLLMSNTVDQLEELGNLDNLETSWRETTLRLQAAADQHAAMTEELEALARSDPEKFTAEQIWVLVRAIKVQGQILQMYLGEPAIDV